MYILSLRVSATSTRTTSVHKTMLLTVFICEGHSVLYHSMISFFLNILSNHSEEMGVIVALAKLTV